MNTFAKEHFDPKAEMALMYQFMKNDPRPAEEKKRIREDMIRNLKDFDFTVKEYLRYRFDLLTPEQQHAFVSDREHLIICERLNSVEANNLLEDKYLTYQRFGKYYKRELVYVTPDSAEAFCAFAEKHPQMIVKPNDDWGGNGVFAADLADYSNAQAMGATLLEKLPDGFLAEERLSNAGVLYDVHPSSLNTCRVSTIRLREGKAKIIHPRVRIGLGGSVTDNISRGGYQGLIDVETGVVTRVCSDLGETVEVHPDTEVKMLGMQMPEWDTAKALVKELAAELNTLHYCGWDIAYTDRGWVMIEGNGAGQFGFQFLEQKGCRAEFQSYLDDLWRFKW